MKTTFYMVRHGESEGNARHRLLGYTDWDLTDKGHAQAACTAEYLQAIPCDVIYASDLLRAYHTAEYTARAKDMPITKDERLREIFAGEWEAMAVDQIIETYPAEFACWRNDIGCSCPPGGEPVAALYRRIADAVTDIAKKHAGQTVFLFSHATPVRAIATHCLGKTAQAMKELPWASNASVTRFTYEDGVFTLEEYGHDAFMGEINTNLPANV